jgi:hypothetical protein
MLQEKIKINNLKDREKKSIAPNNSLHNNELSVLISVEVVGWVA